MIISFQFLFFLHSCIKSWSKNGYGSILISSKLIDLSIPIKYSDYKLVCSINNNTLIMLGTLIKFKSHNLEPDPVNSIQF